MLYAMNHHRAIHTRHINDALYPQQICASKLHQHFQTGFKQPRVYRFLKNKRAGFDSLVTISVVDVT